MRSAAIFAMSFALALLVLTCGALAAVMYHLRRAPEAFEDETGFHFLPSTGNRAHFPLGADAPSALFEAESNVSRRRDTPDSISIAVPRVREAH
jgi:hypothetical protein